ncbi:MAG TPA: GNAT family protein [Kribbellaceae bacterium]|nr:GNAT family protein [Kribbellaceae bacterium]
MSISTTDTSASISTSTLYKFRVSGHLDDHWAEWLGDLTLSRDDDETSTLTGTIADQAQLHGVLGRLRDIGAALLAVHAIDDTAKQPVRPAPLPALERPLRTERLTLRPATAADADATFAYRRLEAVGRWLTEVPTELETYRATFAEPARLATTIVLELDGQLIGDFMLRVEDARSQAEVADQARNTQAELGWVLHLAHTGRGYATEAVRALLTYCFDELKVRRVVANCFLDNDAAWRLMERVGMRREVHAVAESLHRSGEWLDTVAYAILASEWDG